MENIIELNTKKYLGRKQIVLDCKFQIENGKEVYKALAVSGKPILNEVNVAGGDVGFLGKVNLKLVYLTESGERECLNCIADFNESYESDEIEIGDAVAIDLKVVDVTTPSIKANEVKVAIIIDAVISICKNIKCEQEDTKENVYYKTQEKQIANKVCLVNDTFDLAEEFKINGDLKCVLNIDSDIIVKESYCGSGFAVVEGDVVANIVYEDESDELKMYKTTFPFKQETTLEDVNKECIVCADAKPLEYLSKCTVSQGDNCNIIKYEVPININGIVYENKTIIVNDDAYSEKYTLKNEYVKYDAIKEIVSCNLEDSVKGELPLKDGENATLLLNLFNGVEVSSSYMENEKLCVEGVVNSTIIYKDEQNSERSVIAEFPYICKLNKIELEKADEISVKASIVDMDITIKNGNLELVTKLVFNVIGVQKDTLNILISASEESERPQKDCAMEVVFINEDKPLWDLGKMLGVDVGKIEKQNPTLDGFAKKGDKIVVYYGFTKVG